MAKNTSRSKWAGMSHSDKMDEKKYQRTMGKPGPLSISRKMAKHIRTSAYWSRPDWCSPWIKIKGKKDRDPTGRNNRCSNFGLRW